MVSGSISSPRKDRDKGKDDPLAPDDEQKDIYYRVMPLLHSAYDEMSKLSAKKQDGVLNQLKVRNINRLLGQLNQALGKHPLFEFTELLDEETLPQNSDAAFILGQWIAALNSYRIRYL